MSSWHRLFLTFNNLLLQYKQIKDSLKPFLIKEDVLNYETIKLTLKDRNYIKLIQDLFDKKAIKKNKSSVSIINKCI